MRNKYWIFFLLSFLFSCREKQVVRSDGAMEGTIPKGAFVQYKKNTKFNRNDIVVFNFLGEGVRSETHRVLRVVGLPGDTLEIRSGNIYINHVQMDNPKYTKFPYYVRTKAEARSTILQNRFYRQFGPLDFLVALSNSEFSDFRKSKEIDSISLFLTDSSYQEKNIIKDESFKYANSDYLGPILIPRKGDVFTRYIYAIGQDYSSKINDNGKVKSDCYFLMGDNRLFSYDSKHFGIVPETEILGVVNNVSMKKF